MPMARAGFGGANAGNTANTVLARNTVVMVPSATETTIVSYTAVGKQSIGRISVTGQVNARYRFYINTAIVEDRIVNPGRTDDFYGPIALEDGDIVDVKVEHQVTGTTPDFDSTIYGV